MTDDTKPPVLTPKQEAFCLAYLELGTAAAAYRSAYDAENMTPGSVWVEAHHLLRNPKVSLRIELLQAQNAEKSGITVESLTADLRAAYGLAMETGNPSAAVSATNAMGKLHGLIVDRSEVDQTNRKVEDTDAAPDWIKNRSAVRKSRESRQGSDETQH